MKIETINVVEMLDGDIMQIVAFTGPDAIAESKELFKILVLEHNDPDHSPPEDVMCFGSELDFMADEGYYDDENGYILNIIESEPLTKKDLDEAKTKLTSQ